MEVKETHYVAVPGTDEVNYYRIRVNGKSVLGEAKYQSGWFDSYSVDAAFGDIQTDASSDYVTTRDEIRRLTNEAVKETTRNFLNEAKKANPDENTLLGLLEARKNVLSYPTTGGNALSGSIQLEYNPVQGLILTHSDEKQIFVLSSNPNDVVGNIKAQSANVNTIRDVNRLAGLVQANAAKDAAGTAAKKSFNHQSLDLLLAQLEVALQTTNSEQATREQILAEIDSLTGLVRGLNQ